MTDREAVDAIAKRRGAWDATFAHRNVVVIQRDVAGESTRWGEHHACRNATSWQRHAGRDRGDLGTEAIVHVVQTTVLDIDRIAT